MSRIRICVLNYRKCNNKMKNKVECTLSVLCIIAFVFTLLKVSKTLFMTLCLCFMPSITSIIAPAPLTLPKQNVFLMS